MEKKFISVKEAATLLGVSQMTIHRLVARGKIPSYTIGLGKRDRRLFDPEELFEWVKSQRDTGKPKKKVKSKGKG